MNNQSSEILDRARFQPEKEMRERITERFGLTRSAKLVPEDVRVSFDRSIIEQRASMTRLSREMAPGLIRLAEETFARLGLDPSVELLIDSSEEINAGASGILDESDEHLIMLTAGAVKQLTDEQLRYVLGHEIGHNVYGHGQLAEDILLIYRDEPVPELLESRLRVLRRLQEYSADRAGAMAVNNDVAITASALLRVHTGLGPEDMRLDLDAFIGEIARIEAFDVPDKLGFDSHPLLPLRIRALQIFAANPDDHEGVMALARMMDYETRDESGVHQRNVLLAGGLVAAHMDGDEEISDAEREHLVGLVLPFSDDPEGLLHSVGTLDEAVALFNSSTAWAKENLGPERYGLMEKLLGVVLHDAVAAEGEVDFLEQAARDLGIPFTWVEKQLEGHNECASRQMGAPRAFGLRGWDGGRRNGR